MQGVELVGPVPRDLQLTTVSATGIGTGTGAKEQAADTEKRGKVIKFSGAKPE